jgi:hypothetical protein
MIGAPPTKNEIATAMGDPPGDRKMGTSHARRARSARVDESGRHPPRCRSSSARDGCRAFEGCPAIFGVSKIAVVNSGSSSFCVGKIRKLIAFVFDRTKKTSNSRSHSGTEEHGETAPSFVFVVTAVGTERVVVAPGTAVRQYLRVKDDVTGTGSHTRLVAFARR